MFFALERKEVVEERPFRAVKRESFRKRALVLGGVFMFFALEREEVVEERPLAP